MKDGKNGSWEDLLWGVERIKLAHDRDRWRALVNMVTNLRVLAPRNYLVNLKYADPFFPPASVEFIRLHVKYVTCAKYILISTMTPQKYLRTTGVRRGS
jgi:hypothetical protein